MKSIDLINLKMKLGKKSFFALFVIIFLGFHQNYFSAVDYKWFENHQIDSDRLVVDTLHADSIGMDIPCLQGHLEGGWWPTRKSLIGYPNKEFKDFVCYTSQVGITPVILKPFWFLSSLIFKNSSKRVLYNFRTVRTVTALFNALVTALFVFWILLEFNFLIMTLFVVPVVFWQDWVTVFGKSVYWQSWTWYAPLVFNLYYLKRVFSQNKKSLSFGETFTVCLVNFILICIKCLMGYEYISTILMAAVVPFIYYSANYKSLKILKQAVVVFLTSILGFFAVLGVHYAILNQGGFNAGEVFELFISRSTHAKDLSSIPEIFHERLQASIFKVLTFYFFNVSKQNLLIFFVFLGAVIYSFKHNIFKKDRKHFAILMATIPSFLGTISWYILAKGHSYLHTSNELCFVVSPFKLSYLHILDLDIQVLP